MTTPPPDPQSLDARRAWLRDMWERAGSEDTPPPYDEGLEAAMEAVANSVDPETGRPTYRPRRTR